MATHEDMVCLHGEGTYVTATGLACARCGEMLCRRDESDDDRPDEWRKNDWDGWDEDAPHAEVSGASTASAIVWKQSGV